MVMTGNDNNDYLPKEAPFLKLELFNKAQQLDRSLLQAAAAAKNEEGEVEKLLKTEGEGERERERECDRGTYSISRVDAAFAAAVNRRVGTGPRKLGAVTDDSLVPSTDERMSEMSRCIDGGPVRVRACERAERRTRPVRSLVLVPVRLGLVGLAACFACAAKADPARSSASQGQRATCEMGQPRPARRKAERSAAALWHGGGGGGGGAGAVVLVWVLGPDDDHDYDSPPGLMGWSGQATCWEVEEEGKGHFDRHSPLHHGLHLSPPPSRLCTCIHLRPIYYSPLLLPSPPSPAHPRLLNRPPAVCVLPEATLPINHLDTNSAGTRRQSIWAERRYYNHHHLALRGDKGSGKDRRKARKEVQSFISRLSPAILLQYHTFVVDRKDFTIPLLGEFT
ncbi:hypothetical protein DFH27DRAFT_520722 [Peziza echinospora]|nr:hypothetical protein DFH27DRAFT_520722 [Peziza echinospora]